LERYRIVEGIGLYYITFSVVEWLPVFISEDACKIVTESLNFCIHNKALRVNAYVIMPTHLHAILFDAAFDPERLKNTLDDCRKFTGRRLADFCAAQLPAAFTETLAKHAGPDRQRRFWQPTRHPIGIFSGPAWNQKVNYLHMNPCRKGLVRDPAAWRFSSAAFWLDGNAANDVELAEAVW
jgi:hypothetical protein